MIRILFVALLLIAMPSAFAYVNAYSSPYVTPPQSYGGYGGYGVYDGNWGLVPTTPYPYAGYRLAENPLTYGQYSRFTGRYHHPYTGRTMPETWRGYGSSNAIPAAGYPYTWSSIHRG